LKPKREEQTPYSGIERQLLNTFFSGVYISAKDFLTIGRNMNMEGLALKNRELLVKEIIARANKNSQTAELVSQLIKIISLRISEYQNLLSNYPNNGAILSQMIQKSNATKKLIQNMLRTNPYG